MPVRWAVAGLALLVTACGPRGDERAAAPEPASWSVTVWGERFEVFPEVEPLVAGEVAVAHTHVTRLADFAPLREGRAEIVLRGEAGEESFVSEEPVRPGIFSIEISPRSSGARDLLFRIDDGESSEEIPGGKVRVGDAGRPGAPLVAPAPRAGSDGGEPLPFLKEEQWRTDFATAWVRRGSMPVGVAGLAKTRPAAGGEAVLTSPVDGIVRPAERRSWPYPGLAVERGKVVLSVAPIVAAGRSLADLEAEVTTLAADLAAARDRRARLEELLAVEATSRRELDDARLRVEMLAARHQAATRDLAAAGAARGASAPGDAGVGLSLPAPFSGEVSAVYATPGTTVSAGEPLARLVRTDTVWIDVALPPEGARRVAGCGARGIVLGDPETGAIRIDQGLELVSVAPEVAPRTGTVAVLFAVSRTPGLVLGSVHEARVLCADELEGIVVPASALVDDGGVPIVYLQLSGESFARQQVGVVDRQGELALVEGLVPGQRLVTLGGEAIRRSSLMASGEAHGHVH